MAHKEERSIFGHLFLPEKKSRGPKFVLATAAGVGVATLLVVGALAAGGGGGGVTTNPDTQAQSIGALPGSGFTSGSPQEPSSQSILIETATATATVSATAEPPTATPPPTNAPATATATSTIVPPTAAPAVVAAPTATTEVATLVDDTPAPTAATTAPAASEPAPTQPPAALLAAAPTSTPVTQTLAATATPSPTPTTPPTASPTPTRTATPVPTKAPSTSVTLSDLEAEMLEYHNEERTSRGIPALALDAKAVEVARIRSKDMADNDYFSHDPPNGVKYSQLLKNVGASFSRAGENIAWNSGYSVSRTASVAMYGPNGDGGLMASPGHRENILDRSYNRIGIGVVKTGNQYYYTMIFLGGN